MLSFRGGIHPPGMKHLVRDRAIVDMPLVPLYRVLVQQHIGAPAKPLVKAGDTVKRGQVLSEPLGFVSASVHAPTSGKVRGVENCINPVTGLGSPCVVIEADGEDAWAEGIPFDVDPFSMDGSELISRIRSSGIVGMGGATFPSHVKLSPPREKPIDAFIVNGVECEPYLGADHRLMLEEPQRIVSGARLVMHILGLSVAVVAIEANKLDAVEVMRKNAPGSIRVEVLDVKYPQGAEKQLIKAILDREVPPGGLPMDVGALVHNAGTCAAIWDACSRGIPLIERVTSVTGSGIREPKNIRVRVGTPLRDVIDFCGGLQEDASKVIFGGPMMGIAQYSMDVPVTKGTSGILVLRSREVDRSSYTSCISCGRCVDACPMGLLPNVLSRLGEKSMWEDALGYNLMDCIECGSCAYVCPAYRPIVHFIKHMKALAREASAKKRQAV